MKRLLIILALFVGCNEDAGIDTSSKSAETDTQVLLDISIGTPDTGSIKGSDTGWAETPGGFGWPCDSNSECTSGWCVESPEGDVCSQSCSDTCPDGWTCKAVSNSGADLVYVCVSPYARLCWPCAQDADCQSPTAPPGAKCLAYDSLGGLCGISCSDGVCPSGYDCEERTVVGGGSAKQCVPTAGDCNCNVHAVTLQLETQCHQKNEFGSCSGRRQCQTANEPATECDAVLPEAEVCDGIDNDCDGETDGESASDCIVRYVDNDGDGFGVGAGECTCNAIDVGYADKGGDCNDLDKSIHPEATEVCNLADDNCNNLTDEEGAAGCKKWYSDGDKDGWGDDGTEVCACTAPNPELIGTGGDCNDADANVHPEATELCDKIDNNCDTVIDESNAEGCTVYYPDEDGDGYGQDAQLKCLCESTETYNTELGGDCDDTNDAIHPLAVEICNGVDDNCDTVADEDGTQGCSTFYKDVDGDGFGLTDETQCLCSPNAPYTAEQGGDCDDVSQDANPDAEEVCDSIDNDCDGQTDLGVPTCVNYYIDSDGDGYGKGNPLCLCFPFTPYVATKGGDCNDQSKEINPGALESCATGDENCDGELDGPGSIGCTNYFRDQDGDEFGVDESQCLCAPKAPYNASKTGDCYDDNAKARPGQGDWFAIDRGDGSFDYDCDGQALPQETAQGACGTVLDCDTKKGWKSGTPACGQTASWIYDCDWKWFKCHTDSESKTQMCR